jgi:VIT1/CCC1 family predicted Fe2+/Mn2+ transporter
MDSHLTSDNLDEQHRPAKIAARLAQANDQSYLGDFVLGAIDGAVTTFAIVAGVAGANYSATAALILGVANLLADGFSMAVGNYLSTKSKRQLVEHVRRVEQRHIDEIPDGEREEIRQIFARKGFEGETLESIVDTITADPQQWIDTMVSEEFGLAVDSPSPAKSGITTFVAFILAGFVPLVPYCFTDFGNGNIRFAVSAVATGATFFAIGWIKGRVVSRSKLASGIETLAIGGTAAAMAYLVGMLLRHWLGGSLV